MNTAHRSKRALAGILLSGGAALAAHGLAAGTAHAFTVAPMIIEGDPGP